MQFQSLGWEDPLEKGREWQPTWVFLPGKNHRQRSLLCYNSLGKTILKYLEFALEEVPLKIFNCEHLLL